MGEYKDHFRDIEKKGNQTQLTFTHLGLVPAYECYNICNDAWGNYIRSSLKGRIATGKGKPNPKKVVSTSRYWKNINLKLKSQIMQTQDFHTSITVNANAKETFDAINNIAGWWTDSRKGDSRKLNDEFTVYFYHGACNNAKGG